MSRRHQSIPYSLLCEQASTKERRFRRYELMEMCEMDEYTRTCLRVRVFRFWSCSILPDHRMEIVNPNDKIAVCDGAKR